MARNIIFSIGEYYHLYGRGTEKRDIFLNSSDRNRFLALLHLANDTKSIQSYIFRGPTSNEIFKIPATDRLVDIGAYCLMPNHFHILVREKKEKGLSRFMQKLLTAYTMFFNKKYVRTGALFESRFRAKHADTDEYLKYLISYIHLNPVKVVEPTWKETGIKNKAFAKKYLENYLFSSYQDYLNKNRAEGVILNRSAFPNYFEKQSDFQTTVNDWLTFPRSDLGNV